MCRPVILEAEHPPGTATTAATETCAKTETEADTEDTRVEWESRTGGPDEDGSEHLDVRECTEPHLERAAHSDAQG